MLTNGKTLKFRAAKLKGFTVTQTVPAISEKPENLLGVVQICSHSGATYHICRVVAETISVKYTRHTCQHSAPDIALMLCTCL